MLADQSLTQFIQIMEIETSKEQTRINDAAVDPFGGVVFGTMHDPENPEDRCPLASLYRLAPDGSLKKLLSDVVISNGLEFSPDGQIMYFADSNDGRIRRYSITSDFEEIHELAPLAEQFAAPENRMEPVSPSTSTTIWCGVFTKAEMSGALWRRVR